MLRAFSVLVLSTLIATFAWSATASGPAPGFTLKSREGKDISLASFKGQVVLLNFWATWCGPCREEMPKLQALYEKYNALGFALVGVNVENNPDGAKKWLEDNGPVTFPILLDTKNEVSKLYRVDTMPSTVL
ncbi:MAG TPA: TlpA disulfide reductase family protein, partial [Gammaproteobacteria bacterium]|nr:TlpA disulfide reductase family protein [Gammaproteobacteria bacterium]